MVRCHRAIFLSIYCTRGSHILYLQKFLHIISSERTDIRNAPLAPTFAQHQKAYSFCIPYIAGKKVLEIGCGSSYGTKRLAAQAKQIMAFDTDKITVNELRSTIIPPNVQLFCEDFTKHHFDTKFDAIISLQVIEHAPNPTYFLEALRKVLKPDGVVILSTPNAITQSYNENPYHYKEYQPQELYYLLQPFFRSIHLYGLQGDAMVSAYEAHRKQIVLNILRKDFLKLRRLLPRPAKQFLGDIATYLARTLVQKKQTMAITEENYTISQHTKDTIDLIAVCKLQETDN